MSSTEMQLSEMMQTTFEGRNLPQPVLIAITLCLGALALVGIFGNILVVVFFYRGLRDLPQNVYVIALATLDTTVCAIVIPSTIYQDVWRETTTDFMCKGFHVLRCSLVTSSAFLLCLIAVDRFAIICFVPGIQTGRRRSVALIGLTLLLGFAVGTPLGLTTGTQHTVVVRMAGKAQSRPVTLAHCTADYSILPLASVKVYKACLTLLFLCMLLAIVFFYAYIFYFVRRRQSRWDKSRSYVCRVSGGGQGGGDQSGSSGSGKKGSPDKENGSDREGCKVRGIRFLRSSSVARGDQAEVMQGVMETDIDKVLSDSATDRATDDEGAAENTSDEEAAKPGTEPAEHQRMLSTQRREDSVISNRLAKAQKHLSERSRKRPHIKTAKVLSIITFFYLLSYLPFFLVFHLQEAGGGSGMRGFPASAGAAFAAGQEMYQNAMNISWQLQQLANLTAGTNHSSSWWNSFYSGPASPGQIGSGGSIGGSKMGIGSLFMQTVYYFYFINHGVNPIIYGCMNTYFKQQIYGMYDAMCASCRGR